MSYVFWRWCTDVELNGWGKVTKGGEQRVGDLAPDHRVERVESSAGPAPKRSKREKAVNSTERSRNASKRLLMRSPPPAR